MAKEITTIATEEQFKNAVKVSAELNKEIKTATTKLSAYKPELIKYMKTNGITKEEVDGFKAAYSQATTRKMNEAKVIEILQKRANRYRKQESKDLILSAIEYKPSINETIIEDLLYKGFITSEDLEPALEERHSERLTLSYPK